MPRQNTAFSESRIASMRQPETHSIARPDFLTRWGGPALLTLFALWLCVPLFGGDWFVNHDRSWYIMRTESYVKAWRAGTLYPRWAADHYGGHGSPFFNYYAPLFYAASGLLRLIGTSSFNAPKVAVLLFSAIGAIGVYRFSLAETERRDAALLATALFVAMPYRIHNLYIRGDLAEYSALSLFPFSLWFFRKLAQPETPVLPIAALAALSQAAVLMMHTITGQWSTELLAVVLLAPLYRLVRAGNFRRVVVVVSTGVCSVGLAAIYLLPAFFERKYVSLEGLHLYRPEEQSVTLKHLLDLSAYVYRMPIHPPNGFLMVGAPLLIAAIVSIGLFVKIPATRAALPWWIMVLLLVAGLLPQATPLWRAHVLPFGEFIQFPWRLLGHVTIFGALALAMAWRKTPDVPATGRIAAVLAFVFCLTGQVLAHPNSYLAKNEIPADENNGTTVGNEYLPLGAKLETRPYYDDEIVVALSDVAELGRVVARSDRIYIDVEARAATTLLVEQFCFPGWRLDTRLGPAPAVLRCRDDGRLLIDLPVEGRYRLRARMGTTPVRLLGTAMTLISLAGVLAALVWSVFRSRPIQ